MFVRSFSEFANEHGAVVGGRTRQKNWRNGPKWDFFFEKFWTKCLLRFWEVWNILKLQTKFPSTLARTTRNWLVQNMRFLGAQSFRFGPMFWAHVRVQVSYWALHPTTCLLLCHHYATIGHAIQYKLSHQREWRSKMASWIKRRYPATTSIC